MGVKQHFMGLREVRHQQERTAGGKLVVRHLQAAAQTANEGVLTTSV
jgi:hypothetical protein